MDNEIVKCTCKKIIIEYWTAITPDGREVAIKGIDKDKLVDGMKLEGTLHEDTKQDMYADGTYARSITTEEWLQVNKK